jgi:hypothetical protein
MPLILTTAGNVLCGHDPSKVTVPSVGSPSAKLAVQTSRALLKANISNATIATCVTIDSFDSSGTPINLKCHTVTAVTLGEATKLTAGGAPVMLQTLTGDTDGMVAKTTPQKLLHASPVQSKLTAV